MRFFYCVRVGGRSLRSRACGNESGQRGGSGIRFWRAMKAETPVLELFLVILGIEVVEEGVHVGVGLSTAVGGEEFA